MTLIVRQLVTVPVASGSTVIVANWNKPTKAGNALAYLLVLKPDVGPSANYTVTHAWDLYSGAGSITRPTGYWMATSGIIDSDSNAASRASETFTFANSVAGTIILIEVAARNSAYNGFDASGISALAASGAKQFSTFVSVDGVPINPASVPGLVYALVGSDWAVADAGSGAQSNPTNGWTLVMPTWNPVPGFPPVAGLYVRDVTGGPTDDVQLSVTLAASSHWIDYSVAGFYVATSDPTGFGFGVQPFGP